MLSAIIAVLGIAAAVGTTLVLSSGDTSSSERRATEEKGETRASPPKRSGRTKNPSRLSKRAIRPAEGIGLVILGDRPADVERKLGKLKTNKQGFFAFEVGDGELTVSFSRGSTGKVVAMSTTSSYYELNGVSIDEGFEAVRAALPEWEAVDCGAGVAGVASDKTPSGPSTSWMFMPADIGAGSHVAVSREPASLDELC